MNTTDLRDIWNEQKAKLKQKFSWLTDTDFLFEPGKREDMLNRLQIKLGKTREELHVIMATM